MIGEHRRRSLADRAPLPVIGDVRNLLTVTGQRHPQRHLVTARGVDVVHLGVERVAQTAVVRVFVVIEDHFLVHLLQSHVSPCRRTRRPGAPQR